MTREVKPSASRRPLASGSLSGPSLVRLVPRRSTCRPLGFSAVGAVDSRQLESSEPVKSTPMPASPWRRTSRLPRRVRGGECSVELGLRRMLAAATPRSWSSELPRFRVIITDHNDSTHQVVLQPEVRGTVGAARQRPSMIRRRTVAMRARTKSHGRTAIRTRRVTTSLSGVRVNSRYVMVIAPLA